VSLYGYYGPYGDPASSPLNVVRTDAPPFFVAHGDLDTIMLVDDARQFVELLRRESSSPVVYAELPGAQDTFDLFHSLRFEAVVDGIEAFVEWSRKSAAD
jgi:acetyl esterase/lipase